VFLIKHLSNGEIKCYKAQLVAKGYNQCPRFDYMETFAPTPKWVMIWTILALAVIEDLEVDHVDISSAFLNVEIDAEVYMEQIEGFPHGPSGSVLQLKKGLYGLKQSPRLWYQKLDKILANIGFDKVKCEASVWVYRKGKVRIMVPVFVDDLLVVSPSKTENATIKAELRKVLKLRDLGEANYFLAVLLERDHSKCQIMLTQSHYIEEMLQ